MKIQHDLGGGEIFYENICLVKLNSCENLIHKTHITIFCALIIRGQHCIECSEISTDYGQRISFISIALNICTWIRTVKRICCIQGICILSLSCKCSANLIFTCAIIPCFGSNFQIRWISRDFLLITNEKKVLEYLYIIMDHFNSLSVKNMLITTNIPTDFQIAVWLLFTLLILVAWKMQVYINYALQ